MRDVTQVIDVTDTTAVWSEQARERWLEMVRHLESLKAYYGPESKSYTEAAASFGRITTSLVGFGSLRVSTDMCDLSLFCDTGGYVFGLIWHPSKRHCTVEGCRAVINDDGTAWVYMRDWHMCNAHEYSYPLDAPHPGTWSHHS